RSRRIPRALRACHAADRSAPAQLDLKPSHVAAADLKIDLIGVKIALLEISHTDLVTVWRKAFESKLARRIGGPIYQVEAGAGPPPVFLQYAILDHHTWDRFAGFRVDHMAAGRITFG